MTIRFDFDTEEWLFIGYVVGLLVWYAVESVTYGSPDSGRSWTDQEISLSEDHLRRLEDGETVQVRRWHGHDLVLGGSMVIDVDALDEEAE
ncbi:hypothetical protein [Haloarchaeobius sp. DT45]|uniref:hypothetical protein n=1 Tax=Haloarchaeobius sp. DT45 TaxID=3446116 RepID=UPI003F6B31B7